MAEFSATSAATEGFKVIKNHPMAIAIWGFLYLAMWAVAVGIVLAILGVSFFSQFINMAEAAEKGTIPDRTAALGLIMAGLGAVLMVVPIAAVVGAMVYTAVNRIVLRPEQISPGYLRLGMDELRVFGVRLVLGIMFFALFVISIVACVLLTRLNGLLGFVGALAGIAGLVFLLVRLSLAVPLTFATRNVDLFGSWVLTKGHFWPILGSYLLAFVFYLIVAIVVAIVLAIFGLVAGAGSVASIASGATPAELIAAVGTMGVIRFVVQTFVSAAAIAILCGPAAAIYRDLSGQPDTEVF